MKPLGQSSVWLELDSSEAAQIFADPRSRRFIEPFIGRERTVKEVAAELDVTMSSALYRVRQLAALGLLEVTRSEPRHGRPIKHYRAVAEGFFVPFELTLAETFATFRQTVMANAQRLLDENLWQAWLATNDSGRWGVHIFRGTQGDLNVNLVPEHANTDSGTFFERLLEPHIPAVWDQHALCV